jgi:hypothetical protein
MIPEPVWTAPTAVRQQAPRHPAETPRQSSCRRTLRALREDALGAVRSEAANDRMELFSGMVFSRRV